MRNKLRDVVLPFSGFYGSVWADALDQEFETLIECEYESELNPGTEAAAPLAERIPQDDFCEMLGECQDWRKSCEAVARHYVDALANELPEKITLKFVSLDSPRFYNFETDRIFASISFRDVVKLFRASQRDAHKTLAATIAENCTSYSGFHSHYPNTLEAWLEIPLADWDHNHLGILIQAIYAAENPDRRLEDEVFDSWTDGLSHEFNAGIDWERFETLKEAKRAELRQGSNHSATQPPLTEEVSYPTP